MNNSSTNSSTFCCHSCADADGLLQGLHLTSTSPSTYQIDKAAKHTGQALVEFRYNSALNSGSTSDIDLYSKLALKKGFLEVEPNGTRSLVYQSSGNIGSGFKAGVPTNNEQDSFRWVLSTDSDKAHGYPVESNKYAGITCSKCGCDVSK